MYGNGVLHLYKHLNYNVSLTKINHTYFLYGDIGYIMPQEIYNGIYIKDIIGYVNNQNELKIYISTNSAIKTLIFKDEVMVMNKSPMIKKEKRLPNNVINLKCEPLVYYYWKVIFVIGNLICVVLGISLLYGKALKLVINKK